MKEYLVIAHDTEQGEFWSGKTWATSILEAATEAAATAETDLESAQAADVDIVAVIDPSIDAAIVLDDHNAAAGDEAIEALRRLMEGRDDAVPAAKVSGEEEKVLAVEDVDDARGPGERVARERELRDAARRPVPRAARER